MNWHLRVLLQTFIRNRKMREPLDWICYRNMRRKKDAVVARNSGKYTIGGPYLLKQGGTGALLFNPVYQDNNSDKGEFWGFVILVIDWNRFIDEINLDYLSDADFCYRIWTYDRDSSDRIILAESQGDMPDNILTVECAVPNNTWYFDIILRGMESTFLLDYVYCHFVWILIIDCYSILFNIQ